MACQGVVLSGAEQERDDLGIGPSAHLGVGPRAARGKPKVREPSAEPETKKAAQRAAILKFLVDVNAKNSNRLRCISKSQPWRPIFASLE